MRARAGDAAGGLRPRHSAEQCSLAQARLYETSLSLVLCYGLQIELQAESEWVEVHDPDHGEKWYFNPVTGKSQWEVSKRGHRPTLVLASLAVVPDAAFRRSQSPRTVDVLGLPQVPPSLSGLAASDDKAKVLPSVRRQQLEKDAQAEEEAAAAKSKPNKRHSSSLMADALPSAPQQQEDGGAVRPPLFAGCLAQSFVSDVASILCFCLVRLQLLPPLFPGGGPTVNGVNDEPGTGPVMPEEDADSAMTEKSGGQHSNIQQLQCRANSIMEA